MGRNAPRGSLRPSRQVPASDDQTQEHRPARPRHESANGGAATQPPLRALGPNPPSQPETRAGDPSSLSPQELTLHLECVKLTEERLPLGIAYPRFLEIVRRVVGFDHGTLYLTEGPGGALIPAVVLGNRVDLADQVRFAKGPGLSAWVAQEGRPVLIPHPVTSTDLQPFADKGLRAFTAIPLIQRRWVTGVLALSRTEQVFTVHEFDQLVHSSERLATTLSRLRLQAQYRAWTHTDAHTGLSARHHFLARVEAELDRAQHQSSEFAVVVVALDGFVLSGGTGQTQQRVVRLFADRLQGSIRSCDMAALLDEGTFGVLLAGVNRQTAGTILERIVGTMLHGIPTLTPPPGTVRVWGGIAAFPEIAASPDDLVSHARAGLVPVA